jgi:putative ABC transport system permease protein
MRFSRKPLIDRAQRRDCNVAAQLPYELAMDLLWKDIRFSVQSLLKHPGFALIAILTLALGIGATTAIFSVVNSVLLRPLPLHEPSRLTMVWEKKLNEPGAETNRVSPANFTEWQRQSTGLFSSMGAGLDWEMSLTGYGEPELVRAGLVSESLFRTLGARPLLGRVIEKKDEESVVLSYALWQRKFGGSPGALGKQIHVGRPLTIVGVMPRQFLVPESRAELWLPYDVPAEVRGRYLTVIARLAPGVTWEQAQAAMSVIAKRLERAHPDNASYGANVVPVHEQVVGGSRQILLIVFGAVGLLLLIACVNIANLLLSRATMRRREMAVRAALGASRGQLIRQLLTESLMLALMAGIVGIVIAGGLTALLVRFTPESAMLPRLAEIAVDGRALAITGLLTLLTGILFGLAPALEASRADLQAGLKSSGRGMTDRRGKMFRNTLVVAEVALATVMLVGAGLLIKTFSKLETIDPGVRADGVLTMRVVLPKAYDNSEKQQAMASRMLEAVRAVPGVRHAGAIVSVNMPFTNSRSNTNFRIIGEAEPQPGNEPDADIRPIVGDYFPAMGIPILKGRMLDERAVAPKHTEFVVDEAFVRRYFNGGNAIGRRLEVGWFDDLNGEIVGIVGSVRAAGLNAEAEPAIYFAYAHDRNAQLTFTIGSAGDPRLLQKPVTDVLRSLDALMPISDVQPLTTLISGTIARPRFNATMLSLFAGLGLLLASIGIYGVLSYAVSQRTHEMGIRMALGANAAGVRRLVVRDGAMLAVIGLAVGLTAALATTRVLAALLFGVEASDPAVFAIVAAALTAVALAASYIPARRATRIDPMIALQPD